MHFVAFDPTHIHILVSWRVEKGWLKVRSGLQSSMSRALNQRLGKGEWFARQPSRKRVCDKPHFDYLRNEYLPSHRGWKYDARCGKFSERRGRRRARQLPRGY